jgi:tetratricopeptide (TPR) repeat protein
VRDNALDVVEPHNLPLQLLAETGVVGFLLFAGVVGAAALAARRAVGRAGPDRRVVLALALVPGCFLVHALVDISWDFAAVAAPTLLALGAVLALERGTGVGTSALPAQPRPRRAAATALPLVALACAAIASLAVPWGAARTVDEAYAALDRGDIAGAARLARDARGLDSFSLAAYRAWAGAALAAGDTDAAARIYGRAIARHPANGVLRYELGALYAGAQRWREAYAALNDAYTLDPWGPAGRKDGLLDLARAKVEGRA